MSLIYKTIHPLIETLECTDTFEFQPHIHDRYVIWLNTGCGEKYEVKGNKNILQAGSIGIFEPGLVHSNSSCSHSLRHLKSFYIQPQFFQDLALKYNFKPSFQYFEKILIDDLNFWKKLSYLHENMMSNNLGMHLDINILETFLTLLNRHTKNNIITTKDRCDKRVQTIIDYFHANLSSDIRLSEIADIAQCTEFHIIRLFKQHKGMSPHQFLLQLRLEKARNYIKEGNSIAFSAFETGFSDQSHLSRKFKLRYGITPLKYFKQCQFCSRIIK